MSEVRLIDANALMERLERKKCEPAKVRYTEGYNDALMRFRSMVHGAPTIDAVPVVHAHWRRYSYDEAICSHCGYDRWTGFECSNEADKKWDELPPYCEECGARMDGADGERKEGEHD